VPSPRPLSLVVDIQDLKVSTCYITITILSLALEYTFDICCPLSVNNVFGHPNLLDLALLVRWSNHLALNLSILHPKQLLMHIIMEALVKHRIGTSHFRTILAGVPLRQHTSK
jgi:hypothetical protein